MKTMPAVLSILMATGSGHVNSERPIAVAFTAKYYEPEGNSIPSQVYVSDLQGGNRIRLSDPRSGSCTGVQWLGHDTLCWLERHPEGRTYLMVCDLGNRKPVRISWQLGFDEDVTCSP